MQTHDFEFAKHALDVIWLRTGIMMPTQCQLIVYAHSPILKTIKVFLRMLCLMCVHRTPGVRRSLGLGSIIVRLAYIHLVVACLTACDHCFIIRHTKAKNRNRLNYRRTISLFKDSHTLHFLLTSFVHFPWISRTNVRNWPLTIMWLRNGFVRKLSR